MAQKFYHKATVQVAIVVGIVGITVASMQTLDQRSRLRRDNEALREENRKLEIRLAPFLALANRGFPEAPADQRVELLLKKMDQVMKTVEDAARKISPDRVLSADTITRVTQALKVAPNLNVELVCVAGDTESFALAGQIKDAFVDAGWAVDGPRHGLFGRPIWGLVVEFGQSPAIEIERALLPLLEFLGYPNEAKVNTNLAPDALRIIVGAKR